MHPQPIPAAQRARSALGRAWTFIATPQVYIIAAILLSVVNLVDYDPMLTFLAFAMILLSFLAMIVQTLERIEKLLSFVAFARFMSGIVAPPPDEDEAQGEAREDAAP
jgi:hypothetical protein